jgi:hypothetical protein
MRSGIPRGVGEGEAGQGSIRSANGMPAEGAARETKTQYRPAERLVGMKAWLIGNLVRCSRHGRRGYAAA